MKDSLWVSALTNSVRSGAIIGIVAAASPAMAQESAEPEALAQTAGQLQEIIVTARKREEGLQSTPISISAMSGESLEARGLSSAGQLGEFVPNLTFKTGTGTSGSGSAAAVYIRGIGQIDYTLNTDPGVGIYIDGVYVARSLGSVLDLGDVERVEVLRGPQGALFGRNTIGGAISVTTARPVDYFEGLAEVTIGSYDRTDLRATLNVPISNSVMMRATGALRKRDGYVLQIPTGTYLGNQNSLAGRVSLRIVPAHNVDIDFSVDATRNRENGTPHVATAINGTAAFPNFYNNVLAASSGCAPSPGPADNAVCYNAGQLTGSRYATNSASILNSDLDVWGARGNVQIAFDEIDLRIISAYRELSSFSNRDDHAPARISEPSVDLEHQQFSQEIQLAGSGFGSRLKWTLGGYYFFETGQEANIVRFSVVDALSGGRIKNESMAAFGQATYDITDKLGLTAGFRYTKEDKRFLPEQYVIQPYGVPLPAGTPLLPAIQVRNASKRFTPSATVNYRWSPDFMTYLSYSEGFKGGGFTQRIFPPLPETPQFAPELVKVYEAGVKSTFFDRRIRFNAAAFYTDYTDLQINVLAGVGTVTRNAGEARVKGFEMEFSAIPVHGMLVEFGAGYLDARYESVDANAVGVTVDSSLVNTPKWSLNGAVSYERDMGFGNLGARVDWSYRSLVYNDAINTPEIAQPAYHVVNANLTYRSPDERWRIVLGVTNLTDEVYILGGFADLPTQGFAEAAFSRPREWSLAVRRSF